MGEIYFPSNPKAFIGFKASNGLHYMRRREVYKVDLSPFFRSEMKIPPLPERLLMANAV